MIVREVVHAAPRHGYSFTPCCDRTLQELPRYDRITRQDGDVTCNRLSDEDLRILSGQLPEPVPAVETQNSELLMYEMAVSIRSLYAPTLSLEQAFEHVQTAVWELVPDRHGGQAWPAALLVRITTRAAELAR